MRGLNLDQLDAFATVAELGSVSAAAARLNLTQPAVSLRLRHLEEQLGVRLFERVGRRIAPTAAGRELLPYVQRVGQAVAEATAVVAELAQGVAGRVRIGTGATACIYLLPSVLRDLRRRYPAVELVVRTGNTREMLRQLEDNTLDVALATLPAPARLFTSEAVLDDEIVAVFPRDIAAPPSVTAGALADLPLLVYEPGGQTRRIVDDWFRPAGVALKPVMELGSIEAIKQLIAAGLGCGLLPRLAVADEPPRSGMTVRSLSPRLDRRIGLVLRRDKVPDRPLREAIAALRRLAQS